MLRMARRAVSVVTCSVALTASSVVGLAQEDLPEQALAAMKRATTFFTTEIACHGGYLGRYSEDMTDVWGERKAQIWQNWIQPPGCPTVGMAYVRAYEATGDRQFLDAAVGCAHALAWGQLESGGWYYIVDFSPQGEQQFFYRHNANAPDESLREGRNISVLDDNTTQHALRLLMAVDQLVADSEVRLATTYGLDGLIKAQYEDGAWPQQFNVEPPDEMPMAEYTRIDEQGRETVLKRPTSYRHYPTFNDSAMNDTLEVMLEAYRRYGAPKYIESAKRCGDYLVKSQLEPPQAGWAQQYTLDGKPEWARRFEPPAVCAAVTAHNIRSLCELYLVTADDKYLSPVPAAIKWLNESRLPDGRHARFYELGTNKPLYFTRDTYHLTYSDANMPTHYSFQGGYFSRQSDPLYDDIVKRGRDVILNERNRRPTAEEHLSRAKSAEGRVGTLINTLDDRARWMDDGWIRTSTFVRNLETLARYLNDLRLAKIRAKQGPDLVLRRSEVMYDSQVGKLTVVVRADGATGALSVAVAAHLGDEKLGEMTVQVLPTGPALATFECRRAAPNATLRVTLDPQNDIDEPDEGNNEVRVPMREALTAAGSWYAKLAATARRKNPIVIEAESLERRTNVRVEIIKGASGGRAIRLFDETSAAEGQIEVPAGLYLATMVGMGMASDKDAAHVTVGEVRFRGHFGTGEWTESPSDPVFVNLAGGKARLKVTYGEPETLIDKILLYPCQ